MLSNQEQRDIIREQEEKVIHKLKKLEEVVQAKKLQEATNNFVINDSGAREEFTGGMVRDTAAGKLRPDLVRDGPMLLRWIIHLTKGAAKYYPRNWMKATGVDEYARFLESVDRHYHIWFTWRKYGINIEDPSHPTNEPLAEDHAAAVFFNMNGAEYVADLMEREEP